MIGNDNGGGDYDASGSPASAGDAGLHRTWSAKFFSQEDEMGETELMRDTESDQDFGLDKDGGTLHLWLAEQRCDPVYVTVSDARVEKIGFLKKSTTFAIKTEQQSLTQQVRRHFKDFVALRDGLELRFYGLIVPSLPPGGQSARPTKEPCSSGCTPSSSSWTRCARIHSFATMTCTLRLCRIQILSTGLPQCESLDTPSLRPVCPASRRKRASAFDGGAKLSSPRQGSTTCSCSLNLRAKRLTF